MLKFFKPFEELKGSNKTAILFGWLFLLFALWTACSFVGETHLFPTMAQVSSGVADLWNAGLVVHVMSSIWLCTQAVFISIIISLVFCYLSPIPALKAILNAQQASVMPDLWVRYVYSIVETPRQSKLLSTNSLQVLEFRCVFLGKC